VCVFSHARCKVPVRKHTKPQHTFTLLHNTHKHTQLKAYQVAERKNMSTLIIVTLQKLLDSREKVLDS